MSEQQATQPEKVYTKEDVQEVLDTLAHKTVDSSNSFMHSILLLNTILRQSNADQIFDENLKKQARDLWIKMKSMGVQLTDPPLLFGMPAKDGAKDGTATA